jgi:cyclic beta-1,2-glucan synthetase
MRGERPFLTSLLRRLVARKSGASPWNNQEPIRAELFSVERLEEHARSLAAAQPVDTKARKGHPLADRLDDNAATLLKAYRSLVKAVDRGRAITPAAEWLIDNYHLVERQIREIRSDLPPGYYRQLPKLAQGPFVGYPRVFGLAWAFVAHTDSRFEAETLRRYVRAYQEVQPLTIGELWAVSITLRIVLIENLGRLANQIVQNRVARQQADVLANRLLGTAAGDAEPAAKVLAEQPPGELSEAFAVQLVHRLREQGAMAAAALAWLDQHLTEQGTTADTAVRDVHRRQGAANVTVRNIITSMRLISDLDWKELFESTSPVDAVLGAGTRFGDMDFPTRNLYRSAIEQLARGCRLSEVEIARRAMVAARETADADGTGRVNDSGYHLIAGGRRAFERVIGFRPPWRQWLRQVNFGLGIHGYATSIATVSVILLAIPLLALADNGVPLAWLIALGVLGAVPASDAAIALINRAVTSTFGPTPLPALELREGVPESLRTLIAVPILLSSVEAVTEQIERLEIHYLASPEGELHFALLSDWADASSESVEGDRAVFEAAAAGIARLNRRHGAAPGGERFLLLHRRRVWNAGEGRWIGWERKRGKLHELNRLLRGATDTTFIEVENTAPLPGGIRYVITLDADTRLPRDTVRRLIGKMAHPLNHPRFDAALGRVTSGYAVLQPRVTPALPIGRDGTLFQRIFSSVSGIDPYAAAVSDVYQDLFGEGSYAGKGIYDIDAFEAALAQRAPDSTLLSHDLFEGSFARAGLASDVEVVDDFPVRYDVNAQRHHRWMRGDWQLLPWILGRGPIPAGVTRVGGGVTPLGRWKMLDNLRRSLSAPASVLALLVGWALPVHLALIWTVFVLATIALPPLIPVIAAVPPRRPGITMASHLRALRQDLRLAATLVLFQLVFLAHQAWLASDAILRTLWRLLVSRRHLLEWTPAAQASISAHPDLPGFYRWMLGAVAIGVAAAVMALVPGSLLPGHTLGSLALVAPFVLAWLASPAVALWVSLAPHTSDQVELSDEDTDTLRLAARRTWRYFETIVTDADHMLPPDNFQEQPSPVVARRTSPTNIGLYLLSVVSARDFGWNGTEDCVDRLERTFATLARMERFRGHFYNWYGTADLRPLDPKYISSVDSGNLAGHLIALANSCAQWRRQSLDLSARLAGVADALELARAAAALLNQDRRTQTVTVRQLDHTLTALLDALRREPTADELIATHLPFLMTYAST